jgi:hypothetical protein
VLDPGYAFEVLRFNARSFHALIFALFSLSSSPLGSRPAPPKTNPEALASGFAGYVLASERTEHHKLLLASNLMSSYRGPMCSARTAGASRRAVMNVATGETRGSEPTTKPAAPEGAA